jgi:hypothetical protein
VKTPDAFGGNVSYSLVLAIETIQSYSMGEASTTKRAPGTRSGRPRTRVRGVSC